MERVSVPGLQASPASRLVRAKRAVLRFPAVRGGRRQLCTAGMGDLGREEKKATKRVPRPRVAGLEALETTEPAFADEDIRYHGVHHVGLLCANLEVSLEFYQGLLGLKINPDRPNKKLPYRGAWLWIGSEMIHLMELPNPDPLEGRPRHGGRDRHFCVGVEDLEPLVEALDNANVEYTRSMSGRPAVFFRDPDMNCLECVESSPWRS